MKQDRRRTRGEQNYQLVEPTPKVRNYTGYVTFNIRRSTGKFESINVPEGPHFRASDVNDYPPYPPIPGNYPGPRVPMYSAEAIPFYAPIIEGLLDMQLYESYITSTAVRTSFAAVSNLEVINDVIGSKFQSKKGTEFVVNPMTKDSVTFKSSPSLTGGGYTYVITFWAGSSTYSYGIDCRTIHFKVTITSPGYPRGLPASIYDEIVRECAHADAASAASVFADAYAKVQAGEMEVLTTLAESGKTIDYIVSKLYVIARLLRGFTKKAFEAVDLAEVVSGAKKHAKLVDEYWLELRYAIRPLVIDVENLVKALEKESLQQTWTFRSGDLEGGNYQRVYTTTISGVRYDVSVDFEWMEKYTAGLYTRLKFDELNLSRFGLTNFATMAWEIVPFSFIFDWFFNIAGTIAALNPNPIYQVENGYATCKRDVLALVTVVVTPPGKDPITDIFRVDRNSYAREKRTTPVFFKYQLDLNVWKIADLLALASTGFSRRSSARL